METFIQLVFTGLQIGAVYVLFSLGLTLIFGVMKVVNFAHGQFFTMTALLIAVILPFFTAAGLSVLPAYILAVLIGIGASLVFGLILYQGGLRFFQRDLEGSFILTVGVVMLMEGIFLHYFGGVVRAVPPFIEGSVNFLGVNITMQRILLIIVSMVLRSFSIVCWDRPKSAKPCVPYRSTTRQPCFRAYSTKKSHLPVS